MKLSVKVAKELPKKTANSPTYTHTNETQGPHATHTLNAGAPMPRTFQVKNRAHPLPTPTQGTHNIQNTRSPKGAAAHPASMQQMRTGAYLCRSRARHRHTALELRRWRLLCGTGESPSGRPLLDRACALQCPAQEEERGKNIRGGE